MALIMASTGSKDVSLPSAAYSLIANLAGLTICTWFNPNTLPGSGGTGDLILFNQAASGIRVRTAIFNNGTNTVVRVSSRRVDTDALGAANGATALSTGTRYSHIATLDFNQNGSQAMQNYLNGVADGGPVTNGTWNGNLSSNACISGFIGSRGASEYINATEDGVRVYNRVLTQAEITSIVTCEGRDGILNGLLFWYNMNEAASGAASGSANVIERIIGAHATQRNGPTYTSQLSRSHR